ncbi:MAG: insulinase family protein [Clostridia bacterium]|nr:insulinase family protein [Clostridia bacterium]
MSEPLLMTIADGVELCAVQTDMFKTCKINIMMALPLAGDIAAKAALPYLLRRSCRAYPSVTSLNGRLDTLYGAVLGASVMKKGEAQILNLSLSAIDDRFALDGESVSGEAVRLLLDMLFEPKLEDGTFPQDDIDAEKRLLLERMRAEDDDKRTYARRRCEEVMCADEAYSRNRYGTAQEIESLTGARVYAAWREALETAVIRIVTVSSGTPDAVRGQLSARFGTLERRVAAIETQFIPDAAGEKYERETQPLMQGTLVMGFRCGMHASEDMDPAMTVAADIFGGGTYSKLFTIVREQMSLCYFCAARLNRDKGILLVSSGIETENESKTREAILEQLRAVQNGEFDAEMLETSLRSLRDSVRSYTDSPDVLCAWYANQIFRGTAKTPQQRIAEYDAVTLEQVQAAAQKITPDTVFMLAGTGEEHHA